MAILVIVCDCCSAAAEKLVKSATAGGWLRVALRALIVCLINDWPLSLGINVKRLLLTPQQWASSGQAATSRQKVKCNTIKLSAVLAAALNCELTWPVLQMEQCNPSADIRKRSFKCH